MATQATYFQWPGLKIEIDQPTETMDGGKEPRLDWRFVDQAGHLHAWVPRKRRDGYKVPTVERIVDATYWCPVCEDEHEDSHLACRQCGETVKPAYRSLGPRVVATGPIRYTATVTGSQDGMLRERVVDLTEDQYRAVINAPARTVEAIADEFPTRVLNETVSSGL